MRESGDDDAEPCDAGYDSSYGSDDGNSGVDSEKGSDGSDEDRTASSSDSEPAGSSGSRRSGKGDESDGGSGRGGDGGGGGGRYKSVTAREFAAYRMMQRKLERGEDGKFRKTFPYLTHCWRLSEEWLVRCRPTGGKNRREVG